MKTIELTRGQCTAVDDDDYEWVSKVKWYARKNGSTYYACRNKMTDVGQRVFFLHNYIVSHAKGLYVDHINGDGLDNRKSNLRICTFSQNLCNKARYKNNTSGYKGVSWNNHAKRWECQIRHGGVKDFLGYFDDPVEAAQTYDAAAIAFFGEFAKTNF